jgi:hypothetical protein
MNTLHQAETIKVQTASGQRAQITEKHIEQTCTEWLALDGWRSLKTDPVSRKEWGKGFGEVGMADRLYIRYRAHDPRCQCVFPHGCVGADVLWIEFKRQRGGSGKRGLFTKAEKAKIHQKAWHAAERVRGALTLIAGEDFPATIEGLQEFYRNSGLMRRTI